MVSHIDPSQIPGDNLDPDTVDTSADQMRMIGLGVTNQGSTVLTSWQAIAGSYEAPESGTLFSVMDPVATNAEQFGSSLGKVADALNTYAEAVRPIKAELASLKTQATSFVSSIANGVSHTSYSRAGATTSTESWDKDQDSVDKNNDLINKVNAQMVLLWAAERDCANKIYDTIGWSHIEAASKSNPNGYGVDKIPDGTKMPWGADVKRTESCGEKAMDSVGHFVWNGVIVGGLWGTVKGLGTLVLGYNPADGSFFHGSTYGAAWSNLGMLGVGLASVGPLGSALSFVPGPVGDFVKKGQNTLLQAGKGMIAWDEWSKDPATAAGTAVFNVGTILLPGGAETDGVKAGTSAVAATMRGAGKLAEIADPVSTLVKVGATGLKVAMPTITDLTKSLAGSLHLGDLGDLGKIDLPKIEIPTAADHSFDFGQGGDVPGGSAIDVPKAEIPPIHATVDAPPVTVSAHTGGHEPVLVGGGETHIVTGGGDTSATVAHGGGDTPTGPGDHGSTATGGDDGRPWTPQDGDPALSGASHGDGWTRVDDIRGNPIDPEYGQPLADHGHLADQYAPPAAADIPEPVRSLVTDPTAPYGRDLAGDPYTQAEWEERYVGPDDRPVYPGNDGAVPGTRVDFTSIDEYQAHYGDLLDRMGRDTGDFMSFPDTPFEDRGLPGSNLSAPYSTLELTGHLPEHVHIEVSEVAPAFGQPGGGLQVRFIDETTGDPLSVQDLASPDYNVLHHVDDATATSVPHSTDATVGGVAAPHDAMVTHDAATVHGSTSGHEPVAHDASDHGAGSTASVDAHHSDVGDHHGGDGSGGLPPSSGDHDPIAWTDPKDPGVTLSESQHSAATEYLQHAQQSEPDLSAHIQHIKESIPGAHLEGFDERLKEPDSFYRKVATELQYQAGLGYESVSDVVGNMKDTVRYTLTFDPGSYSSSTVDALDKLRDAGYTQYGDLKNSWGSEGYKGINSFWQDSSGRIFEVQFHTEASFDAKTVTHDLYNEQRLPGVSPERFLELDQRQNSIFATVPIPDGSETIGQGGVRP
jgi:hypothetical protein